MTSPQSALSVVVVGAGSPRRVELGEVTRIGSGEDCTVRVEDPMVGRRHAEIRRTPEGRFEIVDLGSRHGIFVRGRRVSTLLLDAGDEILVGPARLRVESSAQEARTKLRRADDVAGRAAIELTTALEQAGDLRALLEALLRTAIDVVEAERGAVLLMAQGEERPSLQVALTRDGLPADVTLSTSLLSEVCSRRAGVLTVSASDDVLLNQAASLVAQKVRAAMCVPLAHHGDQIGVLQLDSRLGGAFTEGTLELVTAMARQASVAIHNAVLAARVEAATTAERERLHALLADLPDGVLLVAGDGRIAFANRRARSLLAELGIQADTTILERIGDTTVGELIAAGDPLEIVVPAPRRRVVLASAHETSGGAAGTVLLVLRDVTRDREREARLVQQERLAITGQLAAGIAHDFNNLLSIIGSFSQFVLDAVQGERQREDLRQVLDAVERAAQLVKQLLALGRRSPEVGRPQVVRIERVIAGLERLVKGSVGELIEVRTTFPQELWNVRIDPSILGQVVLNLVVNARDAMPDGGSLTVTARNLSLVNGDGAALGLPAGRFAALEVTDTGTGMSDEVASRVFEPFFTTKGPGKGTGLGLATAYGIVKQAGGTMTVRTRVGAGTTFSILLPATDDPEGFLEQKPQYAVAGNGETVLLVEDELQVRVSVRRILSDAGYRVLEAGSGAEALSLVERHDGPIDLLLADVVMPGMSGKQLARRLTSRRADVRVLYMSGYFDESQQRDGGIDVVTKPLQRDTLLQRVHEALRGAACAS